MSSGYVKPWLWPWINRRDLRLKGSWPGLLQQLGSALRAKIMAVWGVWISGKILRCWRLLVLGWL